MEDGRLMIRLQSIFLVTLPRIREIDRISQIRLSPSIYNTDLTVLTCKIVRHRQISIQLILSIEIGNTLVRRWNCNCDILLIFFLVACERGGVPADRENMVALFSTIRATFDASGHTFGLVGFTCLLFLCVLILACRLSPHHQVSGICNISIFWVYSHMLIG